MTKIKAMKLWQIVSILALSAVSLTLYWLYFKGLASGEVNENLYHFLTGEEYDLTLFYYSSVASGLVGVMMMICVAYHGPAEIAAAFGYTVIGFILGAVLSGFAVFIGASLTILFIIGTVINGFYGLCNPEKE